MSVKLKEGDDTYSIRERSLGFQWVFTFLLLTRFRVARIGGKTPVFLFDEPASNVHQTAQQRLIAALRHLRDKGASVIYTTHSHHLIDSKRLETTFVVQNRSLDYEDDDAYSSRKTNITVERYHTFVGSYPNQPTYFLPILDVLEYRSSALENIPDVIMTEGKNDYYALSFAQSALGIPTPAQLHLLPGGPGGQWSRHPDQSLPGLG